MNYKPDSCEKSVAVLKLLKHQVENTITLLELNESTRDLTDKEREAFQFNGREYDLVVGDFAIDVIRYSPFNENPT